MGQRLGQPWQTLQGTGDADTLARGADVEAHAPGEPGGARAEAAVPAVSLVELPDEVEQPRGSSFEVDGQLRDLVAQLLE